MNEFEIQKGLPPTKIEQETIITYNKEEDQWFLYTTNPVHARKWESKVVNNEEWHCFKRYHQETGVLIALDGMIEGFNVILKKKSEPMSKEERDNKRKILMQLREQGKL